MVDSERDLLAAAAQEFLSKQENDRTPRPDPSKPGEGGAPSAAPNSADECQRFLDVFGPRGSVWFREGKTFEEAAALWRQLVPSHRY
jgi:hypothetical protein